MSSYPIDKKKKVETIKDMEIIEFVNTSDGFKAIPMKKNISFYLNTESQVFLKYKGKVINQYNRFSDYYGYETSIPAAIEHAKELVSSYEIEGNDLVVSVETDYTKIYGILSEDKSKMIFIPTNWFKNSPECSELLTLMNKVKKTDDEFDRLYSLNESLRIKENEEVSKNETWSSKQK
jgi:hypothetical protein